MSEDGTVRITNEDSVRGSDNGGEILSKIEELGLYQPEPMEPLLCDLCDTEPVTVDREWLGPGKWEETKTCPDCDRETTTQLETIVVHKDRDGWADRLKRIFSETEMSVESLEKSLDRLYGLDDDHIQSTGIDQ